MGIQLLVWAVTIDIKLVDLMYMVSFTLIIMHNRDFHWFHMTYTLLHPSNGDTM